MRLGQAEAELTAQQQVNAAKLQEDIRELNLRLEASENYKKYGLILAGIMLVVRILK